MEVDHPINLPGLLDGVATFLGGTWGCIALANFLQLTGGEDAIKRPEKVKSSELLSHSSSLQRRFFKNIEWAM